MKLKFVFCLVSWLCLLSIGVVRADSNDSIAGMEIMLSNNGVPFKNLRALVKSNVLFLCQFLFLPF